MFSVLYAESNLVIFSGMIPETLRISAEDILGRCDEDPISVSKNANIGMTVSVVPNSYFGKTAKRLKQYVGFSQICSITHS